MGTENNITFYGWLNELNIGLGEDFMICKCLSRDVYGYILVETAKNGPNLWLFVVSVLCVYRKNQCGT